MSRLGDENDMIKSAVSRLRLKEQSLIIDTWNWQN